MIIGIDTGVQTGYAVWNTEKMCFTEITTTTIHRALLKVLELHTDDRIEGIIIEDARKRKFFGKENVSYKAQGAGSVKRDAKVWEDFCEDFDIPYKLTIPKNTKVSEDYFKKLTKWSGRTSNHARDAAMMIVGMKKFT